MADDSDEIARRVLGIATNLPTGRGQSHRYDLDLEARIAVVQRQDMSPTAADAVQGVANYTHTRPAEEATKQEAERTKQAKEETAQSQHRLLHVWGVCAVVIAGLIATVWKPEAATQIAAIVGVMAAFGFTAPTVQRYIDKVAAPKAAARLGQKHEPPEEDP